MKSVYSVLLCSPERIVCEFRAGAHHSGTFCEDVVILSVFLPGIFLVMGFLD